MSRALRLFPLCFLFLLARAASAPQTGADSSPKYVVSQPLFDAIATEYSGERALDNIRGISQFHRIQASPGFTQAREWVLTRLHSYGITDVEVERFPSDGHTRYSTHVGPMAWAVREGELWTDAPFRERLCRFSDQPVCLSTLSNGGEWRGEAVDVGRGTDPASYEGKDVRGRIVFASGYAGAVHREAVIRRGALGVVIYPAANDRPEHPDLVRYNGLWVQAEEKDKAGFGFQISHRQWARLRPLVAAGTLRLRAKVDAELHSGALEVTSAYLRGNDPSQEIIVVAHLDHYKFGANDNASGSASLVEIARTVKTLLEQKKIPPLKRTLRFLWVPEHFGTVAWLTKHPEVSGRAVAAINMDMVGENLVKTNSRMNISRTPDSLPSFLNDLIENVAEQVEAADLVSPNGSHNLFHWRMTPYSAGSDHDMFNDGAVRVPAVQLGHWPDWTHHTNEDTPDRADSTTLLRCGVLATAAAVWLATAGDQDAMRLFVFVGSPAATSSARFWKRIPLGSFKGEDWQTFDRLRPEAERRLERRRMILHEQQVRALRSLNALMSDGGREQLDAMVPAGKDILATRARLQESYEEEKLPAGMLRVPRKKYIGPIADGPSSPWFKQTMGADYAWWQEQKAKFPEEDLNSPFDLIVYEAGNFADGKRTLAEIEDAVAAEFGELPPGFIEGLFDRLAKIGLVEWVAQKK